MVINNSIQSGDFIQNIQISGYQIVETVYSGSRTLVCRAIHTQDQLPVVIKLLKNDYPTFSELVQFRNQYSITKKLNSPHIIQTYSLEPSRNSYGLVMEDFGGVSLQEWAGKETNRLSLGEFLEMAIALCNILDILYRERIIHKDIKPANILINPETKQIKLIDFSIASLLPRETQEIQNANALEGTLAYISPEQTGRMNRGIDYRSDFYSLGVTLYELLTGQLPFTSADPMELVHSHLTKNPIPVHQINPRIPVVLSAIVNKLMAKNAEDRYQSSLGIKHDFAKCLTQLQTTGQITSFELGEGDLSDRFTIPEKLYGRKQEITQLLAAFDRVSTGKTEMMLVAGFSGIGKTAVVNEVHKPITKQRGYFIKGKYDQFQRNIPFSAFVQAFRNLMGQLLSESDQQLNLWKNNILKAVGDNGQVLIEVIPELEYIIGTQPPAPELSGSAAQHRFHLLIQKFIKVFTSSDHPLVIFLDDLQWADAASLQLLQLLMTETKYLLVVGAYRHNEVSPGHPLRLTVAEIVKTGTVVNTLTLQPLGVEDLNQLVADTLNCKPSLAQPLSELIYQKNQGNPFFTTQFLKALYEDGLINLTPVSSLLTESGQVEVMGGWQCDIAQIRALALSDDVVEFMAQRLQKLPASTQEVLKLAACIGAQFDLETLAIAHSLHNNHNNHSTNEVYVSGNSLEESLEKSLAVTAADLWSALLEGLIIPVTKVYQFFDREQGDTIAQPDAKTIYRFLHDRVQQAAYGLIPDDQKQIVHLRIGRLLQQQISSEHLDSYIFAIVNQLNLGAGYIQKSTIPEKSELKALAELNLQAGGKAKLSTAYASAATYLQAGIDALGYDCWVADYALTLRLYQELAEVEYLQANFDRALEVIAVILDNTATILDQIKAHELTVQIYISQDKQIEAIEAGLQTITRLGIELVPAETDHQPYLDLLPVLAQVSPEGIADLDQYPTLMDPGFLAALRILMAITPPIHHVRPHLFPRVALTMVELCQAQGHSPLAAYAYGIFGLFLTAVVQDLESAYQAGKLSLKLLEQYQAKELKTKVEMLFGVFVCAGKEPGRATIALLQESIRSGLEVGDIEYTSYCIMADCAQEILVGELLETTMTQQESYTDLLIQFQQKHCLDYAYIWRQLIQNLRGLAVDTSILTGENFDEALMIQHFQDTHNHQSLFALYLAKTLLAYTLGNDNEAWLSAIEAEKYADGAFGILLVAAHNFYQSLAALTQIKKGQGNLSSLLEKVTTNQALMQEWASHAPQNYLHKHYLVAAEYSWVLDKKAEAIDLYDKAIASAKANQYTQEEALANELAAKFYLDWGKEKIAADYIQEAYYCYIRWGANAKVVDLEKSYPQLLQPILQKPQASFDPLVTLVNLTYTSRESSSTKVSDTLDFTSVIQAAQALSGIIDLNELLKRLTQIIIQNSGGNRCVLLLPQDDTWQVRAISTAEFTEIRSDLLDNYPEIAVRLVQYVKRTKSVVAIDNLQTDLPVIDDYLIQHSPKSIFCLPMLNQGHLVGILYLENQSTAGVFNCDRLTVINFLSAQAAISLENARLYQQSQNYAHQLEQSQLQIIQSEKMSALGNLVAGVAHEMNNPLGFISASLQQTKPTIKDILEHLHLYQEKFPQKSEEILDHEAEIDLEYSLEDLPKIIDSMAMACDRLKNISTSLRTFSRADRDYKVPFYLYEGIDSTILILKHRLKANSQHPEIEVITEYGNIPQIQCFPGQLNQVFMNILANAIDAIEESNHERSFAEIQANPNIITITTTVVDSCVQISIGDNGKGMSEEVKAKVFDHLFTTKEVGKGTGLGLAIAKQIVVEKHGGSIKVNSTLGTGTEFIITLPIQTT